jgi:predicted Rossmann-fold nucleotide-binding protein
MTWQLVQVGMLRERPVVFVGSHWRGLFDWMRGTVLEGGYINPRDFELVRLVEDPKDAVAVIADAKAAFDARRPARVLKPLRGASE